MEYMKVAFSAQQKPKVEQMPHDGAIDVGPECGPDTRRDGLAHLHPQFKNTTDLSDPLTWLYVKQQTEERSIFVFHARVTSTPLLRLCSCSGCRSHAISPEP